MEAHRFSAGWKRARFLVFLLAAFLLLDTAARAFGDRYIVSSGRFWLDDFEITRRDHPEAVWDKVFYGSSVVTGAYREEDSASGYVNCGLDYATIRDLVTLLRKGELRVGSELVLGVNYLAFYDDLETNPTYVWHRGALEPYTYFMRDRLNALLRDAAKALLGRDTGGAPYRNQRKALYYGCLSRDELAQKAAVYQERFWSKPLADYRKNIEALDDVAAWCRGHGVRLRLVWMPRNPALAAPALLTELTAAVNERCAALDIEVLDLSAALDPACFYDVGHVNREYGSYYFMEVVEPWLNS